MDDAGEHVRVLHADPRGTAGTPFGETADRLRVHPVADLTSARRQLQAEPPDCLVVVCRSPADDALSLVEWATDRTEAPALVFTDGRDGVAEAALSAGATDCITAGGEEGRLLLANRVRTATDHRRTVAELETTEARFEALTRNTSFAVITVDEESIVRYASETVEELFGYAPADLVGEPLTQIMPERFHEPHFEAVGEYLDTGERNLEWDQVELPGRHRDGTEVPLGVSFGELTGEDGRLFTAVVRDITDQRARRERVDRLAAAVEGSMDGVAILDDEGCYQYLNDAHATVYGYETPEALVGESWHCLYGDEEVARFEDQILPTVEETGAWRGEATGRRADGTTFPQELSLTALDDGGLVCVVRDVTDRVERRRELENERKFVECVIDALPDVFYVLDTDGTIQRWNEQLEAVTGYSGEALDGMPALELIPSEDHERITESIHAVLEREEPLTQRSALLTEQGERVPHEFSGSRVTDADGEVVGVAGIGRDISDEQLRTQRLAVLSRVLRHNVRNRLNVVTGQADHIAEATTDGTVVESAERIVDAAERLLQVSERAYRAGSLLRAQDGSERVDLAAVVRRGLERATPAPATLRPDGPESVPAVAPRTVELAVAELVENAVEHGGDPSPTVAVEREGGRARVVVADDGPGLPPNERRVLAGERETDLKHGTGLGLWLVRWVVVGAGGRVTVDEPDGRGARVVLSFPAA